MGDEISEDRNIIYDPLNFGLLSPIYSSDDDSLVPDVTKSIFSFSPLPVAGDCWTWCVVKCDVKYSPENRERSDLWICYANQETPDEEDVNHILNGHRVASSGTTFPRNRTRIIAVLDMNRGICLTSITIRRKVIVQSPLLLVYSLHTVDIGPNCSRLCLCNKWVRHSPTE